MSEQSAQKLLATFITRGISTECVMEEAMVGIEWIWANSDAIFRGSPCFFEKSIIIIRYVAGKYRINKYIADVKASKSNQIPTNRIYSFLVGCYISRRCHANNNMVSDRLWIPSLEKVLFHWHLHHVIVQKDTFINELLPLILWSAWIIDPSPSSLPLTHSPCFLC